MEIKINRSKILSLIDDYNTVVKIVDKDANEDKSDRAYGGIIRSVKGKLQEHITGEIVKIAWESIGGDCSRLKIDSKKHKIPIQVNYVKKIKDIELRKYIFSNIENYFYGLSVDKQVYIDDKFVIGIECKAYSENAMIKRILVDFELLKTIFKDINCYLFQLESQLGGDYSKLNCKTYGSTSTHTIMSYFDNVELNIVTFLEGERKVKKPIHKIFKPLPENSIYNATLLLSKDLIKFV